MTQSPYLRCTSPPICRPAFPAELVNRDLNLLQGQRSSQSIPPPLRRPSSQPGTGVAGRSRVQFPVELDTVWKSEAGAALSGIVPMSAAHTHIYSAAVQCSVLRQSSAAQEDRSGAHMSGATAGSEGGDLNWEGHHPLTSLSDICQTYNVRASSVI